MNLPHELVVITPREIPDAYDNPTPALDYGPDAPRRTMAGLLLPLSTQSDPVPGRQPVTSPWWLLTAEPIRARERVIHDGDTYTVVGEPERFAPRSAFQHTETTLTRTEG